MSIANPIIGHSWSTFVSDDSTFAEFCRMLAIALRLAKEEKEVLKLEVHRVEDKHEIGDD